MALNATVKEMKELLEHVTADLEKAVGGNKAAAQRVRTGTVRLEKVAKLYRKESVTAEKKGTFTKAKKKPAAKKKATAKKAAAKKAAPQRKPAAKKKTATARKPAAKKAATPKKKATAKKSTTARKTATRRATAKRQTAKLPSRRARR